LALIATMRRTEKVCNFSDRRGLQAWSFGKLDGFDGVRLAGADLLRKVPGGEALQAIGAG
jgi:hypothetical protein